MSLKPPVGPNVPLVWSDFEDRFDLAEKGIRRVLHDGISYPARPDGALFVEWVGPTRPPAWIDGDTWLRPNPTRRVQQGWKAEYNTTASAVTITTTTVNLPKAAIAGNLLLAVVAVDKQATAINTPAGWTMVKNAPGASVSTAIFKKVAAGGETGVTFTWTTAQRGATTWIGEYKLSATQLAQHIPSYSDTGVTSVGLSTATPLADDGHAIAVVTIDSFWTVTNPWDQVLTDDFERTINVQEPTNLTIADKDGAPGLMVAEKPMLTGDIPQVTVSWAQYVADQANSALVVFDLP